MVLRNFQISSYMLFIRYILFVLFLISSFWANAQKEDYYWFMGYQSPIGKPDTGYNKEFGNIEMNFNFLPVSPIRKFTISDFSRTNASICDRNGKLLFYTNGTKVFNRNFQIMENGDSLNAGYFQFEWDSTIKRGGYRNPQGAIIIPIPNNDSLYYLLHMLTDTSLTMVLYDKQLLVTLVNSKANNGLGKVIFKDSLLIQDTLGGTINAVKHANGKDWWIYVPEVNNNCKYVLSLTNAGLSKIIKKECIGNVIKIGDAPASCFSPDGKKYILFEGYSGLTIFDVNRCTGKLSNPKYCPIKEMVDSSWKAFGVCISPNSRFIYATLTRYIYQYDLWATDIGLSKVKVAEYDGFYDKAPFFRTMFYTPQLAPDGKIYISTGSSTHYLHVIENPNEKGLGCNVNQHGIFVPGWNQSIPYFPHYRMGADSSSCKSGIEAAEDIDIKVYPNPASDLVTIVTGQLAEASNVYLFNVLGQQTYVNIEKTNEGCKMDVRDLPEGIYLILIEDKSHKSYYKKLRILR